MLSKELFAYSLGTTGKTIVSVLAFLTAFYIMRIALVVADKNGLEKKKPDIAEILSALGFLILNIILYIYIRNIGEYRIAEPFWAAITAWIVVYVLYIKNAFFKVPYLYELCKNGFYLDKAYMTIVLNTYNITAELFNKLDICVFGNYKPVIFTAKSGVKIADRIETNIMNKAVSLTVDFARRVSTFCIPSTSSKNAIL